MRADTPVLTCSVAPADAGWLSKSSGRACFGFGYIPRADGLLMTIRAQIGGLQIYCVAEMADPGSMGRHRQVEEGATRSCFARDA